MGALVQAINAAIHAAIDRKSQSAKSLHPSLEIRQITGSDIT
jgi:hypothetical protein